MPNHRFVRTLTTDERQTLALLQQTHAKSRVRNRARSILLSSSGWTIYEIAKELGAGYQTVHGWLDRFETAGVGGLEEGQRSGARPKAGPEFLQQLRIAYAVHPTDFGYVAERWTAPLLREHLSKVTGVQIGEERIRQLIRQVKLNIAKTG